MEEQEFEVIPPPTEIAETPAPETEPEIEQDSEVEQPEADTSVQPTEEPKSRSKERIQQLTAKAKELETEVDYWKNLNKQPEIVQAEESDEVTVDQIATAVLNKQAEQQAKRDRDDAATKMKADVAETIKVYPELDSDDDLAAIVVSVAEKRGISIRKAADTVMDLISKEKETAEKKVIASQASRAGVSSPAGSPVNTGAEPSFDLSSMSEEEKAANWDKVIAGLTT